jgi:cell shape-determining protein MreD
LYQFGAFSTAYQRLNVSRETRLSSTFAGPGGRIGSVPTPILGLSRPSVAATRENRPINAISALLAFITGVIHASLAPVVAVGDLRPNLMLAALVAVTALLGLGTGAVWAFVGGLTVNLLTTDPLGSVPLGLLLVAGLLTGASRLVGRSVAPLALLGGAIGSLLVDLVGLIVLVVVGGAPLPQPGSLAGLLLPTAAVNGLLAALAFVAARGALSRFGLEPSPI